MIRDDELAERPIRTQMLWISLPVVADRDGRLVDKPAVILADIFPYRRDITVEEIDSDLDFLASLGRVLRYEVDRRQLIQLLDFEKFQSPHKTEKAGTFPPPNSSPLTHRETTVKPPDVPITVTDLATDDVADIPAQGRATRIPDPFLLTDEMRKYAAEKRSNVDVNEETEKFVNYWRAKAGRDARKLDWNATWRNWILNARGGSASGKAISASERNMARIDGTIKVGEHLVATEDANARLYQGIALTGPEGEAAKQLTAGDGAGGSDSGSDVGRDPLRVGPA